MSLLDSFFFMKRLDIFISSHTISLHFCFISFLILYFMKHTTTYFVNNSNWTKDRGRYLAFRFQFFLVRITRIFQGQFFKVALHYGRNKRDHQYSFWLYLWIALLFWHCGSISTNAQCPHHDYHALRSFGICFVFIALLRSTVKGPVFLPDVSWLSPEMYFRSVMLRLFLLNLNSYIVLINQLYSLYEIMNDSTEMALFRDERVISPLV